MDSGENSKSSSSSSNSLWWYLGITGIVVACVAVLVVIIWKLYNKATSAKCHSYRCMNGKTVILTGEPHKGAGKEILLNLALRSAKVIIGCNDLVKAKEVIKEVMKRTGNKKITVKYLDISSLFSVRTFAAEIIKSEVRLDVLVHNAGTAGDTAVTLTADNIEKTFATNYLGPFLLSSLLTDLMKMSAPSRLIFVSSIAHYFGKIEFDNLNGEKSYNRYKAYCNAKLAVNLMTKELASRLQDGPGRVTVNCLHPGIQIEDFYDGMFFPFRWVLKIMMWLFYKSNREVAQTTIHLAVSEEVEGITGKYFAECKIARESSQVCNDNLAKRLLEVSHILTEQATC